MPGRVSCLGSVTAFLSWRPQEGDSTTTSSSDDADDSLELELLRTLARRVLGIAALEDRLAQVEATQVRDV